jgi:hypothetical protein
VLGEIILEHEKKIAIVSTIKHVTKETSEWVKHHLNLNVSRIFFCIDHPDLNSNLELELIHQFGSDKLYFLHRTKELMNSWNSLPNIKEIQNIIEKVVTTRQQLNIETLLRQNLLDEYEWVFHIDDDEYLYYNYPEISLPNYLNRIPSKYDLLVIHNYEVLPTDPEGEMNKIKYFKKSPHMVSLHQLESWRERISKKFYFVSYNHGKMGFNPKKLKARELFRPEGVHRFHVDESTTLDCNFLDFALLHYPFPNFSAYLSKFSGVNRKRIYEYEVLGENLDNFYTQSRIIASQGNPIALDQYYNTNIIYSEEEIKIMKDLKLILELNLHA